MVDHVAIEQSNSSFLLHGVKEASTVQKYWMVQKDNTIFPKCMTRNQDLDLLSTNSTEIMSTLI